MDNYKYDIHQNDPNTEFLLQKTQSPDDIEDYDSVILINSVIECIHNLYSNGQINDAFFGEILRLGSEIEKNKSQNIPILIKSEIISILFSIYQNESFTDFKLPVLFCLSQFSTLGFSICEVLLQENFLQLFKERFSFEDSTSNSHLIQIYYNILQCIYQQSIIDQILQILTLRDFFTLAKRIEYKTDIILNIFLCLNELMKHTIDNIEDENVLYEIIHYYFYEKKLQNNENIMIQNVFARNSLAMIKNRLYFSSFNYELFEKCQLFEFLNYYLNSPPVESFSVACDIISLLIAKYHCDYQFDIKAMIDNFLLFNSEKNQFSAVNSIDCMIKINRSLSEHFFADECSLFFTCINSFPSFNSKTKESLFQLIFDLLESANSHIWTLIFNSFKIENQISLFNIISEILDYEIYQLEPIVFLENIFRWASELNCLDICYTKFNEVFQGNYDDKFNFDLENTVIFFQKYFSSEK